MIDEFRQRIQFIMDEDRKDLEGIERQRAALDRRAGEIQRRLDAAVMMLNRDRELAGTAPSTDAATALRDELIHMEPRPLIRLWADRHGGELVVNDLVKAVAAVGRYKGKIDSARGNLYSTVKRMDDLVWVQPGVYRRTVREASNGHARVTPGQQTIGDLLTSRDSSMTLQEKVKDEVSHIPGGQGQIAQNLFRSTYVGIREHDLADDLQTPCGESMARALREYREIRPTFAPVYDEEFFQGVTISS
jgi:hypothetical protein